MKTLLVAVVLAVCCGAMEPLTFIKRSPEERAAHSVAASQQQAAQTVVASNERIAHEQQQTQIISVVVLVAAGLAAIAVYACISKRQTT